jgi:hypothetical protein
MNILFISPALGPDYQCDAIANGMREVYGSSFVDYPRIRYLYVDYPATSLLYGRGFSLYAILGDDSDVDRTGIEDKIASHFYDLVIYGSIQRSRALLELVVKHYKRHEVLLIDGEDQTQMLLGLADCGIYFKRELSAPHPGVHPIHFAIPASKIGTHPMLKNKVRAYSDPRNRSTYVYTEESEYYRDYAESLFAITCHKAGWDCMRHYEIMANRTIPWFLDIAQCPETTLTNLPKPELYEALTLMDAPTEFWDSEEGHSVWLSLFRRIYCKFSARSTTRALAQYVIDVQQREAALVCK